MYIQLKIIKTQNRYHKFSNKIHIPSNLVNFYFIITIC